MMSENDTALRERLEAIVRTAERFGAEQMKKLGYTNFSLFHYGANWIHPKHLAIWICVQTDAQKEAVNNNTELLASIRQNLAENEYPAEGVDEVFIAAESKETVDRVSGGNWWYHFK